MKNLQSPALNHIYQDRQIHFLFSEDENVMVNATEMAKAFGKRTDHYLQNETTKQFIEALKVPDMSGTLDVKIIDNRGRNGIYFCELLALDFATWLDVNFKIWVFKTIKEILFGKYNIHRKKTIEIEKAKKRIQSITRELIASENSVALELLKEQENLAQLQKEKSNAIIQQTRIIQLELFNNQ